MYLSHSLTAIANLAGVPAFTLPCGADRFGLPIGIQLMADHFLEDLLFLTGRAIGTSAEGGWWRLGNFRIRIGLEIHVELATKTKIFYGCAA